MFSTTVPWCPLSQMLSHSLWRVKVARVHTDRVLLPTCSLLVLLTASVRLGKSMALIDETILPVIRLCCQQCPYPLHRCRNWGALGACAPPPIFWVTNTNIIPVPPQSDKIDCRLLKGIKVLFKQPLKVS